VVLEWVQVVPSIDEQTTPSMMIKPIGQQEGFGGELVLDPGLRSGESIRSVHSRSGSSNAVHGAGASPRSEERRRNAVRSVARDSVLSFGSSVRCGHRAGTA
jgi:hypothetical protein